ncbi:hypothetical protein PE066_08675 [Ramlibacter tataouinensis]|uniref:hypothetical protein n=1 Tax=Ramlibacter tataouinensis TaxID=94132 RepID=UPI0022F3C877|nr:hypothetical protein [Ramlibacter tataouinensis]WBY03588.1 hypothetical protein PE066_08675 [Ramlibacter tataouinensis]
MKLPPPRNPFSQVRLLQFGLIDPPVDINGQPGGPTFEPFLNRKTFRVRNSLRHEFHSVWTGRTHQLPSWAEFDIFLALEANPHIIDIREQYPVVSQAVLEDLLAGKSVARNRIPTFDVVLTLAPHAGVGPLRYHVGSYKPGHLLESEREGRRRPREQACAQAIGWTWGYLKRPEAQAVENWRLLHGWAKTGGLDAVADQAAELAHLFRRTTSRKSLRQLLEIFGRRLDIPPARRYHVYAAAFYLGYLSLDMIAAVNEDLPVVLQEQRRA